MAITCSWDKPLGTCYSKYDEKREHPITIWSGGNCLAVFTRGKNRILDCFFCDKEHMERCKDCITDYVDYRLSYERTKQCRQFISVLFKYNIPYTVVLKLEV